MTAKRPLSLRSALVLAFAALPSCGGSQASPETGPPAVVASAPAESSAASTAPGPKAIVTQFLDALKKDDRTALEATTTGGIGWEVIPKRFGTLQSFEVRDDALTVDDEVLLSASMRFKSADLVFVIIVHNKGGRALVTNFRMIEVVQTRVAGRITQHVGRKLKLTANAGWPPEVGAAGDLSKRLDSSIPFVGGGQMSLGRATVKGRDGDTIELEVTEEKSKLKIDGKAVDQLAPGQDIDFSWSLVICTRKEQAAAGPPFVCID